VRGYASALGLGWRRSDVARAFIDTMRRAFLPLAAASLLLPGCDDFQAFEVQNPCPFDVTVAFAGSTDADLWAYSELIPALSKKHVLTGVPAGPYPHEQRIQIRALGHRTRVETVDVTKDDFTWRIPKSFCGD
jgi:hypothetical protein